MQCYIYLMYNHLSFQYQVNRLLNLQKMNHLINRVNQSDLIFNITIVIVIHDNRIDMQGDRINEEYMNLIRNL